MLHRIVTTFRLHMNAISDGEEIKYRYLVSERVRKTGKMKCGQQKQVGGCGRVQMYRRRKPGQNRELKEDFRIRGIFFSLSVARSTKQTKKFYPQIALSWRQALQKTTARWTNSSTFLCASRLLVLSNLTQLQGIWNCTETKRLKPSTSNVRNQRKQKLYLNSGLTLISIKSHLSCLVDLIIN